ncbi:MAG: 4-(cytidine 5'-diphospho)-2-C-methyl-D-erythritol kinase [Chloroflexota bacterium]
MTPLRLAAPAKLNLSLSVTGRRPDGYHELASVFALLDLEDWLLLLPGAPGLRIEGADEIPLGHENLAWRGLVAGLEAQPDAACLALEKLIPVAAGMGGGSSDAAAAWRLGRRWRGADEIAKAASLAVIGADVPFFAAQLPAAYVTGIGEQVEPLPAPEDAPHVVLAVAPFRLSTAAVFAELRRSDWSVPPARAAEPGRNDLLAPAQRLRPEIDDLVRLMAAAGAEPHLTGSGPTLFALTDDLERAESVRARLSAEGLRTIATRLRRQPASIEAIEEADR